MSFNHLENSAHFFNFVERKEKQKKRKERWLPNVWSET